MRRSSWPAARATAVGLPRRLPREDRRAEVGEEVHLGVGVDDRVSPVEFKLYRTSLRSHSFSVILILIRD